MRHGLIDRKLLGQAILIPADIGDHNTVIGEQRPNLGQNPLRPDRHGIGGVMHCDFRAPGRHFICDLLRALVILPVVSFFGIPDIGQYVLKHLTGVSQDADFNRVVFADFFFWTPGYFAKTF